MKPFPIPLFVCYAALVTACCCLATHGEPDATPAAKTTTEELPNVSDTYKLSPKDVVHIRVFHEDDLETTARISKDGIIQFPLLGTAAIGGETVQEATRTMERLLREYLVH